MLPRWTSKYADPEFLYGWKDTPGSNGVSLPLEDSVTLISTRSKPSAFDALVQMHKTKRPDVRPVYLSSRVVSQVSSICTNRNPKEGGGERGGKRTNRVTWQARRLLVGYRIRLDDSKFGPYYGGSTPSSGFLALYLAMQVRLPQSVKAMGRTTNPDDVYSLPSFASIPQRKFPS